MSGMTPVERKAILTDKGNIKITFPYDPADVARVKTLPGRRFDPNSRPKCWTAPVSIEAVQKLKAWGFKLDQGLLNAVKEPEPVRANIDVPGLKGTLRAFQKYGVGFIESRRGRALVADEMGLGKTIQALAWLQLHPEKRPAVVVCPASLKFNWQHEAEDWLSDVDAEVIGGRRVYRPTGDVIVVNYDVLDAWVEELKAIKPQVLIIDEAHYIKTNGAKRTKAVKSLAKNIPHVIALTGTPVVNRPIEAYNAIKLVDPKVIPDRWTFAHRYCDAKHNGFGWDFSGSSNENELHELLTNTIMIRRTKADVLKDLPDKVRTFLPIELSNKAEYGLAERQFLSWVRAIKGEEAARRTKVSPAKFLTRIAALRHIAAKGKLKQAKDWIRNFIDSDGKLVVFAVHKDVIDDLMQEFGDRAVKVDGSVTGKDRDLAVRKFQNDPTVKLFIGNVKAAGVGLTLTAASSVAFLELPWSPGDVAQAEDRVHRIGQKNAVNIYYLLAPDTIEYKLARMIDRKRRVLDAVLDGKTTDQESLLAELIDSITNP